MGARINAPRDGFIYCEADEIRGCDIYLDYPSVGATENIILASVFADGETVIRNAAKEPEIVDLQNFLLLMGVKISGAGTSVIRIEGCKKKLDAVEKEIMPDRIVTGTYMVAAAITEGDILLRRVIPEHNKSVIYTLNECGCRIEEKADTIRIHGPSRPQAIDIIRTLPYPGFPTDMQAQIVSLLSIAKGTSIVVETVFENRYKHVEELLRMGADIKLEGRIAVMKGVDHLRGATVYARDLRGGAGLVLAGLAAEGTTTIENVKHIDRGYESIEHYLSGVGASIKRVQAQ